MTTTSDKISQAMVLLGSAARDLRTTEPPWLSTARGEIGVRELPGPQHEARVLEYLATCHRDNGGNIGDWGADRDETPWCSAFVNWCMLRAGIEGTRHAAARSWLHWGVGIDRPRPGCVVVLSRPGGFHVALWEGQPDDSRHSLLGGNQDNAVSIKVYGPGRVIGCRWPEGVSP